MTGRPWYAFYPDAYERDAGDLTYVQDSAYRRLLDHYYKTGEPLSLDRQSVYRACRALRKEERTAIDHCLQAFFDKQTDGYHQARADVEIQKSADVSAKRSQAANKRYCKTDAIAEQKHTHSTATTTEDKSTLRVDRPEGKKSRRGLPEVFPLQTDLDWCRDYWLKKGRVDLCEGVGEEIEKFRDHHSGHNTASANWPGSWRTWCRRAMTFNRNTGKPNGKPSANDTFLAASRAVVGEFIGSPEGGDDSGPANEIGRPLLSA